MDTYLDPLNKAFVDEVSKGDPLYTKTYEEARNILESIQSGQPASDVAVEEIQISAAGGDVTTVIFRPSNAKGQTLPVVYYTHGGGWILGR